MRRPLVLALTALSLTACVKPTEGDRRADLLDSNPALVAAFLIDTTVKSHWQSIGTQYHYLGANGRAIMVEPGRDRPNYGGWFIRSWNGNGTSICMRYPTARDSAIIRQNPRDWNCEITTRMLREVDEIYDGDVLGLKSVTVLPMQMPPDMDVPIDVALKELGRPPTNQPNKAIAFD